MHQPRIRGPAASAGVRLRASKRRSAPPPWALGLGKGLYFFYFISSQKVDILSHVVITGVARLIVSTVQAVDM